MIRPGEGAAFVQGLPVRRFHGIGPKGAEKMARLGIETGADLAARDAAWLRAQFGSFGEYLFRAARGIDLRPVRANRLRKSIGGERTFGEDISSGSALRATLDDIVEIVWERIAEKQTKGRTITLKLKFTDFQQMTRARSLDHAVESKAQFAGIAHALLAAELPLPMPIRLMGLTLSNLERDGVEEPAREDGQLSLL